MKIDLPVMQCVKGCQDCCGVIPCSQSEFSRVERYAAEHGIEARRQGHDVCPFAYDGKCNVYPARPYVCRVFGHGEPPLECPHGRNVNVPEKKLRRLDVRYRKENAGQPTRLLQELAYELDELNDC